MTYNVFGGTLNPTLLLPGPYVFFCSSLYLRTLWCYVSVFKNSLYLIEPDEIGPLPGGLTNYCHSVLDTVVWVIGPVKIVPISPIMCLVGLKPYSTTLGYGRPPSIHTKKYQSFLNFGLHNSQSPDVNT